MTLVPYKLLGVSHQAGYLLWAEVSCEMPHVQSFNIHFQNKIEERMTENWDFSLLPSERWLTPHAVQMASTWMISTFLLFCGVSDNPWSLLFPAVPKAPVNRPGLMQEWTGKGIKLLTKKCPFRIGHGPVQERAYNFILSYLSSLQSRLSWYIQRITYAPKICN